GIAWPSACSRDLANGSAVATSRKWICPYEHVPRSVSYRLLDTLARSDAGAPSQRDDVVPPGLLRNIDRDAWNDGRRDARLPPAEDFSAGRARGGAEQGVS